MWASTTSRCSVVPARQFHKWFDRLRSPNHHFHEMDYRDYFDRVHEGPIGVYFYDGDHTYEHQLLGLRTAERFFGDNCVVIVDDTNWVDPYEATYDFMAESEREYTVLLDQQTVGNGHPTFWNGLLILQASGRAGRRRRRRGATSSGIGTRSFMTWSRSNPSLLW